MGHAADRMCRGAGLVHADSPDAVKRGEGGDRGGGVVSLLGSREIDSFIECTDEALA